MQMRLVMTSRYHSLTEYWDVLQIDHLQEHEQMKPKSLGWVRVPRCSHLTQMKNCYAYESFKCYSEKSISHSTNYRRKLILQVSCQFSTWSYKHLNNLSKYSGIGTLIQTWIFILIKYLLLLFSFYIILIKCANKKTNTNIHFICANLWLCIVNTSWHQLEQKIIRGMCVSRPDYSPTIILWWQCYYKVLSELALFYFKFNHKHLY